MCAETVKELGLHQIALLVYELNEVAEDSQFLTLGLKKYARSEKEQVILLVIHVLSETELEL